MSRNENQNSRPTPPPPLKKPLDEMLLSLCPACAQQFYDSPEHFIKRADYTQTIKDECDFCQQRRGYSFIIIRKGNR
jgi:mRNA interferase MazF